MVDGQLQTATLTVSMMEKLEIIRLPDAQDVTLTGDEDTTILVTLAGTDDADAIASYTLTSLPDSALGTLFTDGELDEPAEVGVAYTFATFYFVPAENFKGDVEFTYTVTDAGGYADPTPATVTITVTAVDDQVTLTGTAVDGYIVGATVFADTNGDGDLDPGEAWATTGANGQFTLVGGSGPLVLVGGTDMSTGLAFEGTLKAPAGSTVVTPLTTLIEALIPENTEAEDLAAAIAAAETQVLSAFGIVLAEGQSLTTLDPVAAALGGDTVAAEVYAAGIQIQNLIVLAAAASGGDLTTTATATFTALANEITTVNLSSPSTTLLEAIVGATDVTALQQVVTAVNTAVDDALVDPGTGLETLTLITQVGVVAQGDDAAAAASGTDTGTFITDLDTTIQEADVGVVGGTAPGTTEGNDSLIGTSGNDAIDGDAGQDTILGLAGNDFLFGGSGNDVLNSGEGADHLFGGSGSDTLSGGAGDDIIDGGENPLTVLADTDRLDYSTESGGSGVFVNLSGVAQTRTFNALSVTVDPHSAKDSFGDTDTLINIEGAIGTEFDDIFIGGDQSNSGTNRSEIFEGLAGNDTIQGGIDTNWASYVSSPDGVVANISLGVVDLSDPKYESSGTIASGTAYDGFGDIDTLININRIRGSAYDDILIGGGFSSVGNERFEGMAGNDTIDGGGGTDYVHYARAGGAVTVNFDADGSGTATGLDFDPVTGQLTLYTDSFYNIEGVRGSAFADTFQGVARTSGALERYEGMAGNDTIYGGDGQDQLDFGQSPTGVVVNLSTTSYNVNGTLVVGETALDGFGGVDTFTGIERILGSRFDDFFFDRAATSNRIDGGLGVDTVSYAEAASTVTVNLGNATSNGGGGNDTLFNIENVIGSAFNDTITGDTDANRLEGGAGNDSLIGGNGNDTIFGGDGVDTLIGGIGDDILAGGRGNDILNGGDGLDTFVWSVGDQSVGTIDTVIGFGGSSDVLDLKDLLVGDNAGNIENYLSFTFNGTDTTLNVRSDGVTLDQQIIIAGANLNASNTLNDSQVINDLLIAGKLVVD